MKRIPLCSLPTPLHEAPRLGAHIGIDSLFFKRDDLTGRVLGGNKLRKIEYILAEAKAKDADVLITVGTFRSNHVCLLSAAAEMMGMRTVLILKGAKGETRSTINRLIQQHLHTEEHIIEYDPQSLESRMLLRQEVKMRVEEVTEKLTQGGQRPFYVPEGGACLEGTYAFVEAFDELQKQMQELGHHRFDIFLPVGTGSTFAGLWTAARRSSPNVRVRGISIGLSNPVCKRETHRLAKTLCAHLQMPCPTPEELDICDSFVSPGYAEKNEWSHTGVEAALLREGILVDHTYTGKALGGTMSILKDERPKHPVVFWHTGGVAGAIDGLREM